MKPNLVLPQVAKFFRMKQFRLEDFSGVFFSLNYESQRSMMQFGGLIAVLLHFGFYFVNSSLVHMNESIAGRLISIALYVPCMFVPRTGKIPWIFPALFEFANFFLYGLLLYLAFLNDFNFHWMLYLGVSSLVNSFLAKPWASILNFIVSSFIVSIYFYLIEGVGAPMFSKAVVCLMNGLELMVILAYIRAGVEHRSMLLAAQQFKTKIEEEKLKRQVFEVIAQAIQMLAHDVRKPFSALQVGLNMILQSKSIEEMQEIGSSVNSTVNAALARVNVLINDVLEIGKKPNSALTPLEATGILRQSLIESFSVGRVKDVKIDWQLKHKHYLLADAVKIQRIFSNIILNALQAMKGKGELWIHSRLVAVKGVNFVEFVVGNSGSFIEAEKCEQIFSPFFSENSGSGTGLGLTIARKLVVELGGEIRCRSRRDYGVEFVFTVLADHGLDPAIDAALPTNAKDVLLQMGSRRSDKESAEFAGIKEKAISDLTKRGKTFSLLILDDEPLYAADVVLQLFKIQFPAGTIATKILTPSSQIYDEIDHSIDCLLVDIDLGPDFADGFQVVERIRSEGYQGFICMHTNRIFTEDTGKTVTQGAQLLLQKPISSHQLLNVIHLALERESDTKDSADR